MWKNSKQKETKKHRSQAAKCKQQWEQERPHRYQRENQECKRTFETQEQLHTHEHQHKHNINFHTIYNLGPEGRVDCRKMIYHSTPKHEKNYGQKFNQI